MSAHQDQKYGSRTYSQHGEDLMLLNIFTLMGLDKPTYLDVGAHHPEELSNTKLLYDYGSRGVNVDANVLLIEEFKVQRPEDKNICIGIAPNSGILTFYMYDSNSGRNTFCPKEVEKMKGAMTVREAIQMPVVTLNQLVNQHCSGVFPHLLSMDIEGLDFEVLSMTDFSKSKPIVIIVETRRSLPENSSMRQLLKSRGYCSCCRMGENLIFIQDEYFPRTL